MATYTICAGFVEACRRDVSLARKTLFHFVHDCVLRVAIDTNGYALDSYKAIAMAEMKTDRSTISEWLKSLGR